MKLTKINRLVALVLALIWLLAGALAIVLGLVKRQWLLPALGVVALWYGLVWLRVVREGKAASLERGTMAVALKIVFLVLGSAWALLGASRRTGGKSQMVALVFYINGAESAGHS